MQALANSLAFWLFAFLAIVVVYLLPTLIGMVRRVDRVGADIPCQPDRSPDGYRLASRDDLGVRAEKGSWPAVSAAAVVPALTTRLPGMTGAERPPSAAPTSCEIPNS